MAWRSNHQAVYPDPSVPFSAPACPPSMSRSAVTTGGHPYSPSSRTLTYMNANANAGSSPISIPVPLSRKTEKDCPRSTTTAKNVTNSMEVGGWLDAMKALSPPRDPVGRGIFNPELDAQQAAATAQDDAWMDEHPSALRMFDGLMRGAAGKRIAVFLDYDGTLSPIVEDPDRAFMSDLMRATVRDIATHFPTAIISGRGREKVYDFVQLPQLYYAGSHGMDIMGPAEGCNGFKAVGTLSKDKKGNDVVLFQPGSKFRPMMDEFCKALEERATKVAGARVEHNKYCVSLHFRRVKEESWKELAEQVEIVLKRFPKLRLTQGRKVLEIRPAIEWDKGKALEFLLEKLDLQESSDVLPIYLGDDGTDEDAFKVLKDKAIGYGILVSTVPKKTKASYSLRDPSEVMEFLRSLVRWRIANPLHHSHQRGRPSRN